jgi:hypothetical protein
MKIQTEKATMTFVSKETEKYQLEATAQYQVGGKMTAIQNGTVRLGQRMIANFSLYSDGNFNFNFNGATEAEQQEMLAEIHSFIAAIEEELNTNI